ncbi:MAG: IS1634 family transposase, partial [Actinomycetes bacterium]
RVLFALVCNRALKPYSKLAAADWASRDVHIPGLEAMDEDQAYRAMDVHQAADCEAGVQEAVFFAVADLLNLEVDLLFFDTTSTYFERDEPEQGADGSPGFRALGHSKDHRPDLPQVVIAMAVTRDGVPVRCWTFPGNASDTAIIRTVKDDLAGWNLRRMVWVADRGFASAANRAYLTRGGGHYIHAEKLRHTNTEAAAAMARAGRYRTVAGNLRVKEVQVGPGGQGDGDHGVRAQRFVVCHNPEQADRDATVRDRLVAHLESLIVGSDGWAERRRDELVGSLKTKPGLRRYLRRTNSGLLRIDAAAIKRESHLDGKWLLRTSDVTLTPEDLAAAYKQLLQVERGWRDMKGALGLRPVFHYREDRIRAHVQLCWLALLLLRVVENATDDTWRNVRHELDRMHLITLATTDGQVAQRSATTGGQKTILAALELDEPARFFDFTVPTD